MRFWDASALVPLVLEESRSSEIRKLLKIDPEILCWWGSPVECFSALWRLQRMKLIKPNDFEQAKKKLLLLFESIDLITPNKVLREKAIRLLGLHSLRAGDSLQLAAALRWSEDQTQGREFVCLDDRLSKASKAEGFIVLPVN